MAHPVSRVVTVAARLLPSTVVRSRAARAAVAMLGSRERLVEVAAGPLRGTRLSLRPSTERAFWAGTYEEQVQRVLIELGRGRLAFDVGSYIGFLALVLARTHDRVVAVEPLPANVERIRRNVAANGAAVEIVHAGVADAAGKLELELGPTAAMGKLRGAPGPTWLAEAAGGTVEVPAVTLDGLAARFGFPDVIKLDVEGAAGMALRGAARTLRARPVVLCELHSASERADVEAALSAASYAVSELGTDWIVARPRHASDAADDVP